MCGIVGYTGNHQAKNILLEGLKRLEYRGYDSAGISVLDSEILTIKAKGKIEELEKKLDQETPGFMGIAHTRWATHGEPNEINAHPHHSEAGDISVVHNGIIENYQQLKRDLEENGHVFRSETDSEVLAHLVEKYYDGDLREAVQKTLKDVKGTYGIIVMHKGEPQRLIAARLGSPLIVGLGEGENFVASDVSAILGRTKQVIYLNDGELADVTPTDFDVLDVSNKKVEKEVSEIDWDITQAERGGYDSFMLKEIHEEPEAVANAMKGRLILDKGLAHFGGLNLTNDELRSVERIIILGCGSANYVGLIGEYMIEQFAGIPVEVEVASEFRYRNPIITPKTLVLVISQSGETADTLEAMREAQRKGAKALGIINVVGSTIAREADGGVYIHAGPEIAVATTKAFLGQAAVLSILTLLLARMHDMSLREGKEIANALKELPQKIEYMLKHAKKIEEIAENYKDYPSFFFLGRGSMYPVAEEGALKLKEVSYLHAEAYPIAEMKHGPIALIDKNFPSVVLIPQDHTYEKNMSNIQEIKARGGKVLAIASEGDNEIAEHADHVITIPKTHDMLTPLLALVPLHLLSYYIAKARGLDVDKPRNLAKSVTVE